MTLGSVEIVHHLSLIFSRNLLDRVRRSWRIKGLIIISNVMMALYLPICMMVREEILSLLYVKTMTLNYGSGLW